MIPPTKSDGKGGPYLNHHLKYFYALVQYGSFTEAAAEMFISQSALSQHVRALEEELDVKLIERSGRKLELTPAGDYFYCHSRMVLTDYETICAEAKRISNRGNESLSIGYLKSCDGLELGKIDIALCEQKDTDLSKFIMYPIVTVDFFVEISSNDPLSAEACVSIEDLKFLSGILVANGAERENELLRLKETHGFSNSFLFADTLREARMLAASRKGFIPMDGLGDPEYLKPAITRVRLYANGRPVLQPYCGYWKASNDKAYIKEFVDILRARFPENKRK